MGLVFQVLIVVALLFCESYQLGTRDASISIFRPVLQRTVKRIDIGNNTGMGPYDLDVKLIGRCETRGLNLTNDILEAYNTKTDNGSKIVYRGNLTVPFTKEQFDTLDTRVKIFHLKGEKEIKKGKYEGNLCRAVKGQGKELFVDIKKKLGLEGDECIIPKGFYSFSDWQLNLIKTLPQILEYGHYKATLEIFYEREMFFCYTVHSEAKRKN